MKKIVLTWARSLSHVLDSSFYAAVAKSIQHASTCLIISGIAFILCAAASFLSVPYISNFFCVLFSLRPPSVAMLFSPFYAPFLVQAAQSARQKWEFRWMSVWWSLGVYSIIAAVSFGLYWVYAEGSLELLVVLAVILAALLPFLILAAFALPVAGVAVLFPPMKNARWRKIWNHSQKMTWAELPFIVCLLSGTVPFSLALYEILGWAVRHQVLTMYSAGLVIHGFTVLCWEIGWLAFMVFYQQRKHLYV